MIDPTTIDPHTIVIPPVRATDPNPVRDWKHVAIQAQQDIRSGGRGDITVAGATASFRLAVVTLRNLGVAL